MNEYDGAVLFVDILGISALTTSEKPMVDARDFMGQVLSSPDASVNQQFCARLLSIFRKNLHDCVAKDLKIAQLSDCAFLWSRKESLVVQAAQNLFCKNAETGILARGGMTFGQIIEPEKTRKSLGHFICGNAVTRAAKLESVGKGARIFIDREIGGRQIEGVSPKAFEGLPNPSDYSMIDEFLWFSCPKSFSDGSEKVNRLEGLVKLLVRFMSSPSFRWNAASAPGRVHLGATIERLCKVTSELCIEVGVDAPHFAMQTSELFQEMYVGDQHSEQAYAQNLSKVDRWLHQLFSGDR